MEKRIFISSDIEGTCGIAHWDETEPSHSDYAAFAEQMTKEVSAACEGVLAGGADDILIRDAHHTARNIKSAMLPDLDKVRIMRGWARDPYAMMSGLNESFYGVMFTGYHSAAGWNGNPLSHTMNSGNVFVKVNDEDCSELMMNCLTASMLGVPVLMVTGDQQLCDWFHTKVPDAITVPVSQGIGTGSISIMPGEALRRIRAGAKKAMMLDRKACIYPTDAYYTVDICYREHPDARRYSWYPGARQLDSRTVRYESDNWFDVLTFFHFCL